MQSLIRLTPAVIWLGFDPTGHGPSLIPGIEHGMDCCGHAHVSTHQACRDRADRPNNKTNTEHRESRQQRYDRVAAGEEELRDVETR